MSDSWRRVPPWARAFLGIGALLLTLLLAGCAGRPSATPKPPTPFATLPPVETRTPLPKGFIQA